MNNTNHRRKGFLPKYENSLSADTFVGIIVILLFMGLVIHTLAPVASNQTLEMPSEATEWLTKDDCTKDDIVCLIYKYSAKYGINTETALRIAKAESNFKADVVNYNTNGTEDVGVFQINTVHKVDEWCRLDAECNIEWAIKKMSEVGTQPWYSSKHKWYE